MRELGTQDVSRETFDALCAFEDLVRKWSPKINLVSKADLSSLWSRHIQDSAQIFSHAPTMGHWVDIGSGGGFPAVVAAILSRGAGCDHRFTLVESDKRKCAFLRTASREIGLSLTVCSERVEELKPLNADILTARALANLTALVGFAERHLNSDGVAIFPKGETWENEHHAAKDVWSYRYEAIRSETNPAAAVLIIQDIARV